MSTTDQVPPATTGLPRPRRLNAAQWVAIVLLTSGVVIGALLAFSIRDAITAEERLQGVKLVCDLVATRVESVSGASWPRSWDELEKTTPRSEPAGSEMWKGHFVWPRDAAKVRDLIEIDFSADLASILTQSPETFVAIRPRQRRANYPFDPEYQALLRRLKNAVTN